MPEQETLEKNGASCQDKTSGSGEYDRLNATML